MNFVPKDAIPRHDGAVQATTGEFSGWWTWTRDNYEVHNGPFWHREENGKVRHEIRDTQDAADAVILLDARGVFHKFGGDYKRSLRPAFSRA